MRVFISSTAVDLAANRKIAEGVVLEHDWQPVMVMEHRSVAAGPTVKACQERVLSCDLFLLIVGHRCGWIPSREQGGNGVDSITQIELATWEARARTRPTMPPIVLMTADATSELVGHGEGDLHRASQVVFRARLMNSGLFVHQFAMPADQGSGDMPSREFRALLMSLLSKVKAEIAMRTEVDAQRRMQQAKSNAWGLGFLGVLGGLMLASGNKGDGKAQAGRDPFA